VPAEQQLLPRQRSPATAFNARQSAQKSGTRKKAHRTVYRTCPVHRRTVRWSRRLQLQRLHDVAGALDSVRWRTGLSGAPCDSSLPTAIFWWLGIYKYPNHPTFIGIQVSTLLHLIRAIAFNTRHTKEIKSSPNSTQSFSN
jgi:hypothetical protein